MDARDYFTLTECIMRYLLDIVVSVSSIDSGSLIGRLFRQIFPIGINPLNTQMGEMRLYPIKLTSGSSGPFRRCLVNRLAVTQLLYIL